MQRTFSYEKTEKKISTERVELPVYSKHDLESSIIYHKLFARTDNGYVLQTIQIDDDGETHFSEENFMGNNLGSNADYYLGKGEYASSMREYGKALISAKKTLSFYEP